MNININTEQNITDIAQTIAMRLGVDSARFIRIIEEKIPDQNNRIIRDKALLAKINLLLISDDGINKFEARIHSETVRRNFTIMKDRLAELQVLTLIKKLEKAGSCDEVLNSFIGVLNNKFETVNSVLSSSLDENNGGQAGGGTRVDNINNQIKRSINIYSKYLKRKLKYDRLIHSIEKNIQI